MIIWTLIFILFFFEIARDKRRNKIQKQRANANWEKKLKSMTKQLESNTLSKSENKSVITFALTDVLCSIQLSYLQSKCDCLESAILAWSNICKQKRL